MSCLRVAWRAELELTRSDMMKVVSLDKALKLWGLGLVAVTVMYFGGRFSDSIGASEMPSLVLKWTAVTVAVVCMIPWLCFIAWSVSLTDEYFRRVAVVGTALAFVVNALVTWRTTRCRAPGW